MFVGVIAIVLQVALLLNKEHASNAWKQIFSMPVPRTAILLIKFVFAALLIGLSNLLFFAATMISSLLLTLIAPRLHFVPTLYGVFQFTLMIFLAYFASFFLIAIQLWLSMRAGGNLMIPVGLGVPAGLLNIFARDMTIMQRFFPWLRPGSTMRVMGFFPVLFGLNLTDKPFSVSSYTALSVASRPFY